VLVAVLALFGLGSRITPLPADPGLVHALPRLPASPPERLGALDRYADVGARPLFSEDRRPKPFFLSGEEAAAPAFDLVLTSVLITPALELAMNRRRGSRAGSGANWDRAGRCSTGRKAAANWNCASSTAPVGSRRRRSSARTLSCRRRALRHRRRRVVAPPAATMRRRRCRPRFRPRRRDRDPRRLQ
jgi:hypothetical protein